MCVEEDSWLFGNKMIDMQGTWVYPYSLLDVDEVHWLKTMTIPVSWPDCGEKAPSLTILVPQCIVSSGNFGTRQVPSYIWYVQYKFTNRKPCMYSVCMVEPWQSPHHWTTTDPAIYYWQWGKTDFVLTATTMIHTIFIAMVKSLSTQGLAISTSTPEIKKHPD